MWLGVANLPHLVLAGSCFLSALLLLFSVEIGRMVGKTADLDGWKLRLAHVAMGGGIVLLAVIIIAAFTSAGPKPGSH